MSTRRYSTLLWVGYLDRGAVLCTATREAYTGIMTGNVVTGYRVPSSSLASLLRHSEGRFDTLTTGGPLTNGYPVPSSCLRWFAAAFPGAVSVP